MSRHSSSEYEHAKHLILDAHHRFLESQRDGILLDFTGENLRLAIFNEADLSLARFNGATLRKAEFTRSHLDMVTFEGARLTRVKMTGAVFRPSGRLITPTR